MIGPTSAAPPPTDPSAERVYIVRAFSGPTDLRIAAMSLSGAQLATFRTGGLLDYDPAPSPDGARLAFARLDEVSPLQSSICASAPDGGGLVVIARSAPNCLVGWPAWSPDGRSIAYHSWPTSGPSADRPEVHVMDASGASDRLVCPGTSPSWSPDGARLLVTQRQGDSWHLVIASLDGTSVSAVMPAPPLKQCAFGVWGPGGRIACVGKATDAENEAHIYTIDPTGGGAVQVTAGSDMDVGVRWLPGGAGLCFMRIPSGPGFDLTGAQVYVADADGRNATPITRGAGPNLVGPGVHLSRLIRPLLQPAGGR